MFWLEASFLLWLCIFRSKELNTTHYLIIAALLFTSFTRSAFQGNRGSLITVFTLVAFAYVSSGKKIGLKQFFAGGLVVSAALIVGMLYGTTFRDLKQTRDRIEMTEYAGMIGSTFSTITKQNPGENLSRAFGALADRLDSISPLAVIVSNHEKLLPYEEGFDLADNIIVESTTFFIPRVFWAEKPITTEASKYGDLYFGYPDNSFTMTPMGDLLRNFGPWGIPLGMTFLGMVLRLIYSTLRENQPFSFWRSTLFFMLLTIISYEGTFGMIIPYLFKVGVFSIFGLLIIRFLSGPGDSRPAVV
jgi:oligosaccharide repeat unit polymerase